MQIDVVAETWAAKVASRCGQDWLLQFLAAAGGTVARDPRVPLLVAASRPDRFLVSSDVTWQMAVALGHVALHLPHTDLLAGPLAVPLRAPPLGPLARVRAEGTWFAGTFLMPEQLVRSGWEAHRGDLAAMARGLRVPAVSLAARAMRLGLAL